ncbi:MAG: ribonuclease H-like domain-containing protein, partial [Methanobacteriota archaeon]
MLRNTFQILPGVGPTRERELWRSGIDDWSAFRKAAGRGVLPTLWGRPEDYVRLLERAEGLLEGGSYGELSRLLPPSEVWRMYGPLRRGAVFLDIETTGLGSFAEVTVVGIARNGSFTAAIQGQGLSPGRLRRFLSGASMLVTFNGSRFDLPFLRERGYDLPDVPHWDLRFGFRRLGFRGGLKRIEQELGFARPDDLVGISGFDAVRLWREWEKKGDRTSLDLLVRYSREDVVNLRRLADLAFAKLRERT